jgi:tRNA-dihydrouridine synthase
MYQAEDALRMKRETDCDGWMIARGAMGNPWLFSDIIAALNRETPKEITLTERVETAISQLDQMLEEKGERVGLAEGKKQMAWYIHGISGAAEARGRLMTATSPDEVVCVMRGLIH